MLKPNSFPVPLLCCLKMVPVSKSKGLVSIKLVSFANKDFPFAVIGYNYRFIYKLVLLISRGQEGLSVAWPYVRRLFKAVWPVARPLPLRVRCTIA